MKNSKKPKRLILITGAALVALVVAVIVIVSAVGGGGEQEQYQFAAVTRGAIQTTVVSTGTISALNTVNVGTQVSGQIAKLYVDFNDKVKKGQVLAELDPTLLENAVQSATADQLKAEAQYELALQDYNNNKLLHDKALISDFDFKTSETNLKTAQSNKIGADAALARAKLNLDESVIRAPISGVVIDRAVEEGQTVAASLSAPTLFTIAEDLSNVQITTYVAESDIGSIKPGEKATFTVAAYPDSTFDGKVDIVHLQPQTIQNVVNYVVMVDAVNKDMKLKPGMTATVTFITDERQNALLISNAALQFRPSDEALAQYLKDHPNLQGGGRGAQNPAAAQSGGPNASAGPNASSGPGAPGANLTPQQRAALRQQYQQRRQQAQAGQAQGNQLAQGNNADQGAQGGNGDFTGQSGGNGNSNRQGNGNGGNFNRQGGLAAFLAANPNVKFLWGVDASGKLFAQPVRIGISDGQKTEIISDRVTEGMKFITGKGNTKPAANTNQGRGFGPFFR
jgi:HlyD family secretion protein